MKRLITHLQSSADPARRRQAWGFVIALSIVAVGLAVFLWEYGNNWTHAAEKLAAKGLKPRIEAPSQALFVKAAIVNLCLTVLLLITSRWWTGPVIDQRQDCGQSGTKSIRWAWLILIALVLATAARVPRITLGLYNDEAHNYARLYSGVWEFNPEKSPLPKLDIPRWGETFWLNNVGNNSQPFSVAARLSLTAAQSAGLSVPGEVTEWAARLPSLLAGLLTVVFLTRLAGRTVGVAGAIGTLLLLSLHGWHVRYSTEARGYAIMILGVTLIFGFLNAAFQSGRWRDWLGFGGGVFLCVWAFMGSAYFIAVFCGLVMIRQVVVWRKGGHGFDQVIRPAIAGLFAAMLGLQALLPLVPQLLAMMDKLGSIHGKMGLSWWHDVLGFLTTGVRWTDGMPSNPMNLSVARWLHDQPWQWLGLLTLIAMVLIGTASMIRRGGALRLIAIGSPLAVAFAWSMMARKSMFLHYWYVVYALPWVGLAFGVALASLANKGRRWMAPVVAAVALWPCLHFTLQLRHSPREDERAGVVGARGAPYPHYQGADLKHEPTTMFAAFWSNATLYDPFGYKPETAAELEGLVTKARTEKRDLYVCYAHETLARSYSPELLDRVIKSPDFELVGTFYGQEEAQFTEYLYRLKPRAAIAPPAP